MAQDSDVRLAILSPGDRQARRNATAENSRFADLFRAFAARRIHVEPAIYHDDFYEEVREQLMRVDGVGGAGVLVSLAYGVYRHAQRRSAPDVKRTPSRAFLIAAMLLVPSARLTAGRVVGRDGVRDMQEVVSRLATSWASVLVCS